MKGISLRMFENRKENMFVLSEHFVQCHCNYKPALARMRVHVGSRKNGFSSQGKGDGFVEQQQILVLGNLVRGAKVHG